MNMQPLEKVLWQRYRVFSSALPRYPWHGLDPRLKPALMTPADVQALTERPAGSFDRDSGWTIPAVDFYDAPDSNIPIDFHALPLRQYP